jgi:uncharacterized protein (TIGR04551 family)
MTPRTLHLIRGSAAFALLAATLGLPTAARAQMGPGGMNPGGMGPQPGMGQEPKEEGPAEEAPEEDNKPTDLEPLAGYPEQSKKRLQIFEIDGYTRLRADYMHNFFLGQGYSALSPGFTLPNGQGSGYGLPPFPVPLECPRPNDPITTVQGGINSMSPNNPGAGCSHKNIGGANLRLRLEPTLNVTDMVRVHAQFDVLDNTLLGSTPDSLTGIPGYNRPAPGGTNPVTPTSLNGTAPTGFQYTTQDPPQIGQNGFMSSIVAKRAWAEIDSELGSVRFGRMPWNWGRGIFYNDGNCMDCDVGTTVDRVMALTQLYGHQIAVAWDLGPQGYTAQQLNLGQMSPYGYPYDLSQNDDVLQLTASIARRDNPVQLRERIDRGEPVLNYGIQVVYRNQGNIVTPMDTTNTATMMSTGPQPLTPEQLNQAQSFGALSVTPDLWAKFYYKAFTFEFEGVGVFGKIDHPGVLAVDQQQLTLRQVGWVAAGELRLYRDSFFVGLETGGATGDQAEDPSQYLNYRWSFVQQPAGDHAINNFHFSPDYHVDEIFFRHILGTVTNAIYVKPQAAYWFDLGQTRAVGINGGVIYSAAQVPVSTPGNAINYGVEADVGATYRNTGAGVYGGATWGLFFPMAALNRPASLWGQSAASASSAQILRIFMGVRF